MAVGNIIVGTVTGAVVGFFEGFFDGLFGGPFGGPFVGPKTSPHSILSELVELAESIELSKLSELEELELLELFELLEPVSVLKLADFCLLQKNELIGRKYYISCGKKRKKTYASPRSATTRRPTTKTIRIFSFILNTNQY